MENNVVSFQQPVFRVSSISVHYLLCKHQPNFFCELNGRKKSFSPDLWVYFFLIAFQYFSFSRYLPITYLRFSGTVLLFQPLRGSYHLSLFVFISVNIFQISSYKLSYSVYQNQASYKKHIKFKLFHYLHINNNHFKALIFMVKIIHCFFSFHIQFILTRFFHFQFSVLLC